MRQASKYVEYTNWKWKVIRHFYKSKFLSTQLTYSKQQKLCTLNNFSAKLLQAACLARLNFYFCSRGGKIAIFSVFTAKLSSRGWWRLQQCRDLGLDIDSSSRTSPARPPGPGHHDSFLGDAPCAGCGGGHQQWDVHLYTLLEHLLDIWFQFWLQYANILPGRLRGLATIATASYTEINTSENENTFPKCLFFMSTAIFVVKDLQINVRVLQIYNYYCIISLHR